MGIFRRLIRGTQEQNNAITGAEGALSYNTDSKGLRVHDGVTQGGFEVPVLVAVQRPTVENNYTWYRKYSDGWVEQGGEMGTSGIVILPIVMENSKYYANVSWAGGKSAVFFSNRRHNCE